MRWWQRAARGVARVFFLVIVILMAALPLPVMPIVFIFQKWREKEVAAAVARKR